MIRIALVRIRARMARIRLMNDGTEVVGMGSGIFVRMAAALKNSVIGFRSDEDDPDAKAGYELFRRDISFIEGKDYFELDEVNRCTAKYMLRNGFMRYEPPTGIDRRLVITRLGRRMMDRK